MREHGCAPASCTSPAGTRKCWRSSRSPGSDPRDTPGRRARQEQPTSRSSTVAHQCQARVALICRSTKSIVGSGSRTPRAYTNGRCTALSTPLTSRRAFRSATTFPVPPPSATNRAAGRSTGATLRNTAAWSDSECRVATLKSEQADPHRCDAVENGARLIVAQLASSKIPEHKRTGVRAEHVRHHTTDETTA